MEQVKQTLEYLQSQISHLADSFSKLNQAVTNTAGTPNAPGDALVRLPFLNGELEPLLLATKTDEGRATLCNREFTEIHKRIDREHGLIVRTMDDMETSFQKLQDVANQDRKRHA